MPSDIDIVKPNPYVGYQIKEGSDDGDKNGKKEVIFTYPKSKIFVGGLDFKLQNEDLKQHF